MDKFNQMLQDIVNKDYSEILNIANGAFNNVFPACKAHAKNDEETAIIMVSILLSAIGADGKLTYLEKKFMMDFLHIDEATVDKYIGMYDSKMADLADVVIDSMTVEAKANAATLILCIMAVDETITREETAFLLKIIQ